VRKFSSEEVARVLKAADAHLSRPARLVVIGGTAIGLLSDTRRVTSDLDVLSDTEAAVLEALQRAQVETGLPVPIQPVSIYSAPYDFKDRLQPLPIKGLRHLDARLPEAHDLALMKIARGRTNDLDAIETLHAHRPLRFDTLLERFRETEVEGSRTDFEISFILTVERLYGPHKAQDVEHLFERERRRQKSKGCGSFG
jgi:hypothetical protein